MVVTGAAGQVGSLIVARLTGRWQIRATDRQAGPGIEALDVTDPARCREVFRDADAVVHLAGNPSPEASWEALSGPNVEGAYVVAATAREVGVPRLVLASSQQAVNGYPATRQRRGEDAPQPNNLYGATKAWGEALGSWIALTSDTSVVALRIGYFGAEPPSGSEATPRNLSAWLSHDDTVRLIQAAVECELTGFSVVNGISANRYRLAELGAAEAAIGYAPVDDAFTWGGAAER